VAYAIGIAFAIIICAPTSGGHFNQAITLCFTIWQGFPGGRFHNTFCADLEPSLLLVL
jgi:glycerol uptake facilitator-like aquaporin